MSTKDASRPPGSASRQTTTVRLGLSTCPNDTYLAHALLTGAIETPGIEFAIELLDVQALNERLLAGDFDIAKASYHLALTMAEDLWALPAGSALGFGNGPLLLARAGLVGEAPAAGHRVLCPGEHTTATLLYRMFHPDGAAPRQVVFSEIMPSLERGDADFGVCIHEGRFTYEDSGLELVEDMGGTWEATTSSPLPLGGLFARKSLDELVVDRALQGIVASLAFADEDPEATLPTMRAYAQELDDEVIEAHVDLYVNGWTRELGPQGRLALERLAESARRAGAVRGDAQLDVFVPLGERPLFHAVPTRSIPYANATSVKLVGELDTPSLETEGFVHLSFAEQLDESLDIHFRGEDSVVVLELDPEKVAGDLRFERSRGGAYFPHLHRPIDLGSDVLGAAERRRGPDGRFDGRRDASRRRR